MLRGALPISLAIHASLLWFAGWKEYSTISETGGNAPEINASILLESDSSIDDFEVAESGQIELSTPELKHSPPVPSQGLTVRALPSGEAPGALAVSRPDRPVPLGGAGVSKVEPAVRSPRRNGGREGRQSNTSSVRSLGGDYSPPEFRARFEPMYPREARAHRWEGTVLLLVSIDTQGHVTHARIRKKSGHEVLDFAALASVRKWRFAPALRGGTPISSKVEVPVRYCFKPAGSRH